MPLPALAIDDDKLAATVLPGNAPMAFGGKGLNQGHGSCRQKQGGQRRGASPLATGDFPLLRGRSPRPPEPCHHRPRKRR